MNLFGWSTSYPKEYRTSKSVMIGAPHTSLYDYLFALCACWKNDIPIKFLYHRNEAGILGPFLTYIGGIDISRYNGSMVSFAIDLINNSDKIHLIINAEGSKKHVEKWRTGFYHIASNTNVPLTLSYLDYEDKIAGIGDLFYISGNYEVDIAKMKMFYKNFTPKNPDHYNREIM